MTRSAVLSAAYARSESQRRGRSGSLQSHLVGSYSLHLTAPSRLEMRGSRKDGAAVHRVERSQSALRFSSNEVGRQIPRELGGRANSTKFNQNRGASRDALRVRADAS